MHTAPPSSSTALAYEAWGPSWSWDPKETRALSPWSILQAAEAGIPSEPASEEEEQPVCSSSSVQGGGAAAAGMAAAGGPGAGSHGSGDAVQQRLKMPWFGCPLGFAAVPKMGVLSGGCGCRALAAWGGCSLGALRCLGWVWVPTGACGRQAVRRGLLRFKDRWPSPQSPSSHNMLCKAS